MERKGLCVSKTFFELRSKCINFENDDQDLPEINSDFTKTSTSVFGANQEEEEQSVGAFVKRKYVKPVVTHIRRMNVLFACKTLSLTEVWKLI